MCVRFLCLALVLFANVSQGRGEDFPFFCRVLDGEHMASFVVSPHGASKTGYFARRQTLAHVGEPFAVSVRHIDGITHVEGIEPNPLANVHIKAEFSENEGYGFQRHGYSVVGGAVVYVPEETPIYCSIGEK